MNSTSFIPAPQRMWRKRHSTPISPVPPVPPPALFHVVNVIPDPDDPSHAIWFFDEAITTPTSPLSGLVVGGQGGGDWDTTEWPNALSVEHGTVYPGMPWSNTQSAGGLSTADGRALAAGVGTVGGE